MSGQCVFCASAFGDCLFYLCTRCAMALLVGTNNSRFLLIGTLAETLTNILLDYLLIFGHWGLPQMGFNGAAVASIAAGSYRYAGADCSCTF